MSMPIQRQSESFGIFDDGPRYARDRSEGDLPRGLVGLVNGMGPRIQGGMLNTRTAVNTDGMHPDDHAYHTELPPGRGGEVTWVDDAENYGRNPRREWNPDFGYEPTDEDERRREGVAEDDDSGYNWGPEPRRASRHPFDRTAGAWEDFFGDEMPGPFAGRGPERFFTDWLERGPRPGENDDPPRKREAGLSRAAACQACGGDVLPDGGDWSHVDAYMDGDHEAQPDDNDLDNDEYGQGRDPAAAHDEYEHRMLNQARLAGWADDNPGYDDVMRHIDEQLVGGEPEDKSDYSTDYYHDGDYENYGEGDDAPYEPYDHRMNPEDEPPHPDQDWQQTPDYDTGYVTEQHHKVKDGRHVLVEDHRDPGTGEPDGWLWQHFDGDPFGLTLYPNAHGVVPTRDQAFQAADKALAHPMRQRGLQPRTAEVAVDPAAQQQMVMPAAGGYQPAHRVGLPWRDTVIPGTVIGLDGQNIGVRWDDGQYSSEEPHNIQLL